MKTGSLCARARYFANISHFRQNLESGKGLTSCLISLPLDHQRVTQVRVNKGIGIDRHGPLPSLLPSEKHVLCWRGFTRHRLIINQLQSYRTGDRTSAPHVECNPVCSMLGSHAGCSVGQPFLLFSESCSSPQPPPAQAIGDLELLIQSYPDYDNNNLSKRLGHNPQRSSGTAAEKNTVPLLAAAKMSETSVSFLYSRGAP